MIHIKIKCTYLCLFIHVYYVYVCIWLFILFLYETLVSKTKRVSRIDFSQLYLVVRYFQANISGPLNIHTCMQLHRSISEIRYWCQLRSLGLQSVFQLIPKVISGVEVKPLCRTLEFFHSSLEKSCLHEAHFFAQGHNEHVCASYFQWR